MKRFLLYILLFAALPAYVGAQVQSSETSLNLSRHQDSPRLVLSARGGLSYLTASAKEDKKTLQSYGLSEDAADDYYRDYKLGYHSRANLGIVFPSGMGGGIMHRYFSTSAGLTGFFDPQDGVHLIYGEISEQVHINFYGATFDMQQELSPKLTGKLSYGIGYTDFRDEMIMMNQPVLITGNNLGLDMAFDLQYLLFGKLALNAQLSYFVSSLNKVKYDDGYNSESYELSDDEKQNLSALDLSVGLSYTF